MTPGNIADVLQSKMGLAISLRSRYTWSCGHPPISTGNAAIVLLNRCGPFCRTDLDGDGELTVFDFLEFQNLFDTGDPAADFDGDGRLTIFDVLAFQNEFVVGCT